MEATRAFTRPVIFTFGLNFICVFFIFQYFQTTQPLLVSYNPCEPHHDDSQLVAMEEYVLLEEM
jgi:hypothetical protein